MEAVNPRKLTMNKKGENIYIYLLLKLMLAFGTLLLTQAMFYICNTRIFHVDGFREWMGILYGNIVFGLATIGTFLAPFSIMMLLPLKARWKRWYRAIAEVLYILPVLLILVPRGANMAYYQYTYRLLSDEIFSYLGISGQMDSLVPHFAVDYWYAWVVPLCIFILFVIFDCRIRLNPLGMRRRYLGNDLLCMGIGLVLLWFMARGGFGHFLQPADAAHYCQPKNTALVSNDGYNIFRTMFTPDLEEVKYCTESELAGIYEPVYDGRSSGNIAAADSAVYKGRNVVMIVVESLGQEFMGCYNTQPNAETRTPFLDSLARYCTVYDGRSNGKKSIEGITAINTSIPNLMSIPLTNSKYGGNNITGLPAVLKRHGYTTAFYHGSYNGVMDFDKTCARIGFDEYLGMNEYNADPMARAEDYDGVWGVFDEPFLQYTVKRIGTYREPFFAEVFTVTSHHPFPIPESHKGEFAEGSHPILKCVEYMDYSLRRFFDEAQKQPWYDSTIFIITGDHSGHGLTPEYNDYDGWYRIPMMVFDPQRPEGRRVNKIVQQIDLFPTLVDWLGIEGERFVCFGQSVAHGGPGWQVYYGNGYHVLVSDNPQTGKHDITVIMGDRISGRAENVGFLCAVIQQYNDRIINNKLTIQ